MRLTLSLQTFPLYACFVLLFYMNLLALDAWIHGDLQILFGEADSPTDARCVLNLLTYNRTNIIGTRRDIDVVSTTQCCQHIVQQCFLQVPKRKVEYKLWKPVHWGKCSGGIFYTSPRKTRYILLDCDEILGWYETLELGEGDDLPNEALIPVLNTVEIGKLVGLYREVESFLNAKSVPWFVAFGTAIASARSGVLVNPWDDDIDVMVSKNEFEHSLTSLTCLGHRTGGPGNCERWLIGGEVVITWKSWGMPYKVFIDGEGYPFIDICNFVLTNENRVVVPPSNMINGHVQKFEVPANLMFRDMSLMSGKIISVRGAINEADTFNASLYYRSGEVLRMVYGNDTMSTCKTSYIHKSYCKGEDCKGPLSNHMAKISFPCCLLPDSLRRGEIHLPHCSKIHPL